MGVPPLVLCEVVRECGCSDAYDGSDLQPEVLKAILVPRDLSLRHFSRQKEMCFLKI